MKRLKKDKIKKILAFMVALALMVSCMPSAYTISASETFGDGTDELFTDGELESVPAAEESTPDVSSADQGKQVQQTALTYENDSVKVTAEAVEENSIPQDTTLKADTVNENSSVSYDTVSQKLSKAAEDKGSSLRGFFAFDVYFADADGNRVEPNGRVKVTIEYKTPASPEIADTANTNVTVEKLQYNNSTGETECYTLQPNEDLKVLNVSEAKQLQTVQVETSNAAVFAVMWDSPESADSEDNTDDNVEAEAEQPAGAGDFTDEENPSDPEPTEAPAVTETPAVTEAPAEDITEPDNGDSDPTITEEPSSDSMIVEVIAEEANLRVSPSTDAEVVATVAAGTRLTVLETVTAEDGTTWYKVSYEGAEAYVRSDVAQVVDEKPAEDVVTDLEQEDAVTYTKTINNVVVTAKTTKGVLPEDAELIVNAIEKDNSQYSEVESQLNANAENEGYTVAGFLAYDIYFQDGEGNKIHPEDGKVKVSMEYQQASSPEEVNNSSDTSTLSMEEDDEFEKSNESTEMQNCSIAVMHLVEDEAGNVQSVVDMTQDGTANVEKTADNAVQKAEFETESFSVFTITWQNARSSLDVQLIDRAGNSVGTDDSRTTLNGNSYTISASNAPKITGYSFYRAKVASKADDAGTVIKYLRYDRQNQYSTDNSNWKNIGNNKVYFVYVKNLENVETVDHTSDGIVMRMKDLDGNNVAIGPDSSSRIDIGGSYGNGSIKRNLLQSVLADNGYPIAKNDGKTNLKSLFNGKQVNHLFLKTIYDQTGYYEYSSFHNYAYLGNNSNFTVYDAIGTPKDEGAYFYKRGNFMPYNNIKNGYFSTNTNLYDEDGSALVASDPAKGKELYKTDGTDYYFGMEMEANFLQPKDGKVAPPNGSSKEDMIYEFNGDDDMWIYIDNVLVLDIGGVHDAHSGKINFNTGVVSWKDCNTGGTPKEDTTTIKEMFRSAGQFPDGTKWDDNKVDNYFKGDTFKDYSTHSFKMFYMERGAGASNLHMKFNIQVIPEGQVEVRKELDNTDKEKYSNVKFAFQLYAQEIAGYDVQHNELYSDKYVPLGNGSAVYGNAGKPTKKGITFGDEAINGTTYQNVFWLRPDESAIFTGLQANRKYYVKEIGVKSEEYSQIKINDTGYTEYDENNQTGSGKIKSVETDKKEVNVRPVVVYTNNCSAENSRELRITKKIKDDISVDDKFSFRVQLSNQDNILVPYADGDYYLLKDKNYWYYNDSGVLTSNGTKEIVCGHKTTEDGIITGVPAGYTVSIIHILSGTSFRIEEVNLNSDKYANPEKTVNNANASDVKDAEGNTADGSIRLGQNANAVVTNTPYSKIKVNKVWLNGTETVTGTDSVYVGLYQRTVSNGTEVLTPTDKYAQLNPGNNYTEVFTKLDHNAEYVVRELRQVKDGEDSEFTIKKSDGTDVEYIKADSTTQIGDYDYQVSYSDLTTDSNDQTQKNVTVTNRKVNKITVTKEWTDGAENHESDMVIAGLYKDNSYADKYVILNSENSWIGEFEVNELDGYSVKEMLADDNGTVEIEGKKYSPAAENSVIVVAGKNYKVTYGESTEKQKKTVTITNNRLGTISIIKVDGKNNRKLLEGAEFKLQKKDEQGNFKDIPDKTETTNSNGRATFKNLEPGTYKIIETKAPRGYLLSADGITVEVGIGENKTFDVERTITNNEIYQLPSAGGPGIYGFTISGVAILATALLLFINNKRREEEAERS